MSIFQIVSTVKERFITPKRACFPLAEEFARNALLSTATASARSAKTTLFPKEKMSISAIRA